MTQIIISTDIKEQIPDFKLGIITYHDIVVGDSPQMLKGRLDFFQEAIKVEANYNPVSDISEIKEWREIFKRLGTDTSKYRPSSEGLYRKIYEGTNLGFIHSAADTNNFFSLEYKIPMGIYDFDKLTGPISATIGLCSDKYEGINGRVINLENKLILKDQISAFGSPIVDSKRSMLTEATKNAIQVIYFTPSLPLENAKKMLQVIQKMFVQINGGEATTEILY
jgi:DNA/RNA-binding domain of Phe-tRNA-synthetase-like protein